MQRAARPRLGVGSLLAGAGEAGWRAWRGKFCNPLRGGRRTAVDAVAGIVESRGLGLIALRDVRAVEN